MPGYDGNDRAVVAKTMSLSDNFMNALRTQAAESGSEAAASDDPEKSTAAAAAIALAFATEHETDIQKALGPFAVSGRLCGGKALPASCYNDFYKWTMAPVMYATEAAHPEGVVCTFSGNIRDAGYRTKLAESATGVSSPELYEALAKELKSLTERPFDRELFERAIAEGDLPGWDTGLLDSVCGTTEKPRFLADEVVVNPAGAGAHGSPARPSSPDKVLVNCFVARDTKLEVDRVFVEATGPWHRVTWLETTLMQAIYDVLFRHRMRETYEAADEEWYPKWLADSFVRCVRSCAVAKRSKLKGMLMSGRRTGGLPLMMLQAIYLTPAMKLDPSAASNLVGISSATATYWLKDAGVSAKLIPQPSGTHAHELSMVMGAVMSALDDKAGMPVSQIVGHMAYFFLSVPRGDVRAKMPMLPDTLGTMAFLKTASDLTIPFGPHKGKPVLSVIGMGRQDSGSLAGFKDICGQFDQFTGGIMASEIEVPDNLVTAAELGYAAFGAGGFFGDSQKAWNSKAHNISMAIKVLRVHTSDGTRTASDPVKTGDKDGDGEGKFEADGLLTPRRRAATVERTRVLEKAEPKLSSDDLQALFNDALVKLVGSRL